MLLLKPPRKNKKVNIDLILLYNDYNEQTKANTSGLDLGYTFLPPQNLFLYVWEWHSPR
jgi:hypothetical protein